MRICVFCGSSRGKNPVFENVAADVGRFLGRNGIGLVYGGGQVGLMGIVADAALEEGGEVIGVIPHSLFGKEVAHTGLTKLHEVGSMHERKKLMYDLSDGFIALPGGLGTLEEIFEIITWGQIGLHRKPCGFLNAQGYYDHLITFIDHMVEEAFVKPKHRGPIQSDGAIDILLKKMGLIPA